MLLRDATVATLDPPEVERVDLRIEDGHVVERGRALVPRAGEESIALEGALVLPGLVNAHTHLYSALARGMPAPTSPPRTFLEILDRVWWRLDRALDEEAVLASAFVGALEAARSGTTLLFDHHSSPSFVSGSLEILRGAVEQVGLRSVLCYETSDRNGPLGRDLGLAENREFAAAVATPRTRALVGAHAGFTLSEESLASLAGAVAGLGSGLHVHVGEDGADVRHSRRSFGVGIVERLRRHGLLGPRSLLVHGVHLEPEEIDVAQAADAWLAHCPRSNMNNAVGRAPTAAFRQAALGTDGVDQDMLAELRAAYLGMRDGGRGDAAGAALAMLAGGHRLAARHFGLAFGRLDARPDRGPVPADLVIFDYRPPTPLAADNLAGHLLFGLDRSHVRSAMVEGRFVLRDRNIVTVDEAALLERARACARRLWARMASTPAPPSC